MRNGPAIDRRLIVRPLARQTNHGHTDLEVSLVSLASALVHKLLKLSGYLLSCKKQTKIDVGKSQASSSGKSLEIQPRGEEDGAGETESLKESFQDRPRVLHFGALLHRGADSASSSEVTQFGEALHCLSQPPDERHRDKACAYRAHPRPSVGFVHDD